MKNLLGESSHQQSVRVGHTSLQEALSFRTNLKYATQATRCVVGTQESVSSNFAIRLGYFSPVVRAVGQLFVTTSMTYRVTHLVDEILLSTQFQKFRQLVGRYCSYLLTRQDSLTSQISVNGGFNHPDGSPCGWIARASRRLIFNLPYLKLHLR